MVLSDVEVIIVNEFFIVGKKKQITTKPSILFLIMKTESERAYHQRVLQILDQLEGEVISLDSWICFNILFSPPKLNLQSNSWTQYSFGTKK